MNDEQYWREVAELSALRDGASLSALRSTLGFFSAVRPAVDLPAMTWNRHLMAASLVTADAPEPVQDDALRIVQGCLQDPGSSWEEREASAFLLSRLGNSRGSDLAKKRNLASGGSADLSSPLGLDLVRSAFEMSVKVEGDRVAVNDFQRRFWASAESNRWVSISAPTSAGKSFIVKLWLERTLKRAASFRAVYVVPTRALIEEVSRDLESSLGSIATVTSMPWDARIGELPRELLVLTQERLHILLQQDVSFDLIFVDEAQKLGDGPRGILLQRALDEAVTRGAPQVIFASPLTANPDLLTSRVDGTSTALVSETVTVNQTLLHVNQRRGYPLLWDVSLFRNGEPTHIGEFDLPARPTPESKRLPLVAVALGKEHTGNVVYANRAADAEKYAGQIYDALGPDHDSDSAAVKEVVELVERTVHPQYLLARYLSRGVAFHYGNMPLLVREAVEGLFRTGEVTYLVCTSTLLEGVNLPCQNLFVRAPQKGNGRPMGESDFWNLAGRAGRWGVEFQGNIVCVDTNRPVWQEVPLKRTRQTITRATDTIASDFDSLLEYIREETPLAMRSNNPLLEPLFGILASTRRRGQTVAGLSWLPVDATRGELLDEVIDEALDQIQVHPAVLQKHAGISPFAIQRLHDHFSDGRREQFELPPPEADGALDAFVRAIARCEHFLGADFTNNSGRHYSLALLFVQWMRGFPLAVLINRRLAWMRSKNMEVRLPHEIRSVLNDVEQYARFEGPRYLACYVDVLNDALPSADSGEPLDIAMMMELGVSRQTELSMMSLGMSRTSVVALAELVVADSLSPAQSLEWLTERDLDSLGLPALVVAEIRGALDRASLRRQQRGEAT